MGRQFSSTPDPVPVPTLEQVRAEVDAAEEVYSYSLRSQLPKPQAAILTMPSIQCQNEQRTEAPTTLRLEDVRIQVAEKSPRHIPAQPTVKRPDWL